MERAFSGSTASSDSQMPFQVEQLRIAKMKRLFLENRLDESDRAQIAPEVLNTWEKSKKLGIPSEGSAVPAKAAGPLQHLTKQQQRTIQTLQSITHRSFRYQSQVLDSLGAATISLVQLDDDLIAYGKAGNAETLNALQGVGIDLGTNFCEACLGATTASESRAVKASLWLKGSENYLEPLTKYAIYTRYAQDHLSSLQHTVFASIYFIPVALYNDSTCAIVEMCSAQGSFDSTSQLLPQILMRDKAFDTFLSRNEIALLILNKYGIVIDVNKYAEALLGITYLNACGKRYGEAIPELPDISKKVAKGQQRFSETTTIRLSGREVRFEFDPVHLDNKFIGTIVYASSTDKIKRQATSTIDTKAHFSFSNAIGTNIRFKRLQETAMSAALSSSSVLLQGESGSGKEYFAHAIHNASTRKDRPFITVHCGSLFESMAESTLFGNVEKVFSHEQTEVSIGKLEQASGGTLFLANVEDLPIHSQAMLASALKTHSITRMGDVKPRFIDIRIIASTRSNLREKASSGEFNVDLFYILNVIKLDMIPLRERIDDLPAFINLYLGVYNRQFRKDVRCIAKDALRVLEEYSWPGNMKELQNTLERLVSLERGSVIELSSLPAEIQSEVRFAKRPDSRSMAKSSAPAIQTKPLSYAKAEEQHIKNLMDEHHGNKTRVAEELGVSRGTLYRKLKSITDWS